MIELLITILQESWLVLNESAGYCLFGIFMAGLLRAFMPDDFVLKHLGKNNITSVIKASLIGVPMPICSCGVMPVAMGLRKQGAGKGPTAAFLISTPESGVDSIAVTWALLDPLMTVVRPLAAFITATVAGIIVNFVPEHKQNGAVPEPACACCCEAEGAHDGEHTRACNHSHSLLERMRSGLAFAFGGLLADMGPSLLFGILIAGMISALVPPGFIEQNLGGGIRPMLVMLLVGIPLYVCATASTPIVAALALKGLSPGAALVFLLAGPATNAATILLVAKILGKRIAAVYVAVIASVALLLGMAVNTLYSMASLSITGWISAEHHEGGGFFPAAFSVILLVLILRAKFPAILKKRI
ncbi:MAG: SO_0444 family Cu/Zn efflux transporter [Deltaproteobacteria bacterium]|nr:SO_0444 family Cu/Zn efflux transporter [Deltaproteobacteria bacterium]